MAVSARAWCYTSSALLRPYLSESGPESNGWALLASIASIAPIASTENMSSQEAFAKNSHSQSHPRIDSLWGWREMDFASLGLIEENGRRVRNETSPKVLKYKDAFSKLYYKSMRKMVKLQERPFAYHGFEGGQWTIPITVEQAGRLGATYLKKYLDAVRMRRPDIPILLSDDITDVLYGKRERKVEGCSLPLVLAFPEVFEEAVERYGISCKDIHMLVVDSGKNLTKYVMEPFLPFLNYLAIWTERPEYFEAVVQNAYMDTGLVIELVGPRSERESICGSVVLDLWNGDDCDAYRCATGVELVLDFYPSEGKRRWIERWFGGVPVIRDVELYVRGERVEDVGFMEDVLWSVFPMLSLLEMDEGALRFGEFGHIIEKLQVCAKFIDNG